MEKRGLSRSLNSHSCLWPYGRWQASLVEDMRVRMDSLTCVPSKYSLVQFGSS